WNTSFLGWQARILPQIDQVPLYNLINFSFPDYAETPFPNLGGKYFEQMTVPYARCPTDTNNGYDAWGAGRFQSSYSGSLGSQQTPSANPSCQPFMQFALPMGDVGHGNTSDPNHISGMFSRMGVNLGMKDVTDGSSNVILVGEILPNCNDHNWVGG